eukprot:CAMPEP_0183558708 /NCGR_PEP_ID=MMETSP0371-20130417/89513_1 /TAXON_ID=268820 /ORGANISM="Peridinium aciculiferum, Strain PAER-2" /LENGTH=91 /DNA_ID=CAMNT_0025766221 /DNA_START=29 /DNA_END=300 /DNA_ORIENTATION=+
MSCCSPVLASSSVLTSGSSRLRCSAEFRHKTGDGMVRDVEPLRRPPLPGLRLALRLRERHGRGAPGTATADAERGRFARGECIDPVGQHVP